MNDNFVPPLMSLNEVCSATTLSRFLIRSLEKEGKFPKHVKLAERRIAYCRDDILQWIEEKIDARIAC